MSERRNAEMAGDCPADVGKTGAPAKASRRCARRKGEDRHAFAGVVGAAPCRVIAVIGGENEKIALAQIGEKLRQSTVKALKGRGVTLNVASMTVVGVEVDEIGDEQASFAKL